MSELTDISSPIDKAIPRTAKGQSPDDKRKSLNDLTHPLCDSRIPGFGSVVSVGDIAVPANDNPIPPNGNRPVPKFPASHRRCDGRQITSVNPDRRVALLNH